MKWEVKDLEPAGISWIFTSLLLIGGTFYEILSKKSLGVISLIFFFSQAIYWLTYLYKRYKENNSQK
jgi:hypothetical protein